MNTKFTIMIAAGLLLSVATQAQGRGSFEPRDTRHDKMEIRHDQQDLRHDRRDLSVDRHDLRVDRREDFRNDYCW